MLKPNKRNKKTQKSPRATGLNFDLTKIQPITYNQERVFKLYDSGKNLVLYGSVGSGKTFLGLYLALRDMMDNNSYEKIMIVRSALPGREIGHLPGTEAEKISVYEAPYKTIVNDLYNRDDAYDILKNKGIIQFSSTSFLRGMTYNNSLILVDEFQNLTYAEDFAIVSRLGENSRIIFTGDGKQSDINERKEHTGFYNLLNTINIMDEFDSVQFTTDDIVRSNLVKSFVIAMESLGY